MSQVRVSRTDETRAQQGLGGSRLALLLLIFILGGVYLATLLPGVGYSGDTSKFQFLGKILGIPHPTGYPLYLVLNNLFVTLFPFGSVAYKANLLSAVFAVAACGVLFKLLEYLGLKPLLALSIALTLGLTRILWSQAIIAEVYTLHLLLMVSALYALIRWHNGEKRSFYVATGLYALAFGNHLTSITLLPAFIYIVVVTNVKVFIQPRKILWVLGVVSFGILQYSYLYWRYFNPDVYYAEVFNGANLLTYVTGGDFKNVMFTFTWRQLLSERLPFVLNLLSGALPLLGLATLGLTIGFKRHKYVTVTVLIYFLTHTYYAMNYNIPDIAVYFIPSLLALAILSGIALLDWQASAQTSQQESGWNLSAAPLLLIPLTLFIMGYADVNMRNDTADKQGVEAVLNAVEQNAVILTPGYDTYEYFLYYLLAEGWEEKDVYVAFFEGNIETTKAYLGEGTPYNLANTKNPPPGLRVFCYRCGSMDRLQNLGFTPTQTDAAGLYGLELKTAQREKTEAE